MQHLPDNLETLAEDHIPVPSAHYRECQSELDATPRGGVSTLWENFSRATELYGPLNFLGIRKINKEKQLLKERKKLGMRINDEKIEECCKQPPSLPHYGYGQVDWFRYEELFLTSLELANGLLNLFFPDSPHPSSSADIPVALNHPSVILHVSNTPSWFVIEQAASRLSFPLVPLYDSLTQDAIRTIYSEVEPKIVFTEPGKIQQALIGLEEMKWKEGTIVVLCDDAGWGTFDFCLNMRNKHFCDYNERDVTEENGLQKSKASFYNNNKKHFKEPRKIYNNNIPYTEEELNMLLESVRTSYPVEVLKKMVDPIHNHIKRHLTTFREVIAAGRKVSCPKLPLTTVFSPFETTLESIEGPLLSSLPPPTPNTISSIIYTSGTTGKPKGVLLTHRALTAVACGCVTSRLRLILRSMHGLKHLSYLPLAHVLERTIIQAGIYVGERLCCASSGNAKTILDDLKVVKPDILIVVPRVLERVKTGIVGKVKTLKTKFGVVGKCIGTIIDRALESAIERGEKEGKEAIINVKQNTSNNNDMEHKKQKPFHFNNRTLSNLNELFLNLTIRKATGGNLRLVICGGAYLSPELHQYIRGTLGCDVILGYGSTELGGAVAIQPDDRLTDVDTIGDPTTSMSFRISPDGELEAKGPCMFSGYLTRDSCDKTSITSLKSLFGDSLTEDGWFKTGDKVILERKEVDKDGNIISIPVYGAVEQKRENTRALQTSRITTTATTNTFFSVKMVDRVFSIFKLTNGEFVAPETLETVFTSSPLVEQAMVPPVNLSCVIALVVPSLECKQLSNTDIKAQILESIHLACKEAKLKSFLWPKSIALVPEFSTDNDELTPTMKLRRKAIVAHHRTEISKLEEEAAQLVLMRTEQEVQSGGVVVAAVAGAKRLD